MPAEHACTSLMQLCRQFVQDSHERDAQPGKAEADNAAYKSFQQKLQLVHVRMNFSRPRRGEEAELTESMLQVQ